MPLAPSRLPCPSPTHRSVAAHRWNDDWDHLVRSRTAHDALARWADDPLLVAADLPALLTSTDADAVLGRLVVRAAHDGVAARVVLQRVLPGLIAVARRRSTADLSAMSQTLDDIVSTAWTVIVTYPIERRPAKFAANIVRDAEYLCFVRARRLRHVVEVLNGMPGDLMNAARSALDGRAETSDVNASETVTALLADAERRGLDGEDLRLLRALYVDGRPVDELAAEHDIGARALRYRRSGAVRRLARLAP